MTLRMKKNVLNCRYFVQSICEYRKIYDAFIEMHRCIFQFGWQIVLNALVQSLYPIINRMVRIYRRCYCIIFFVARSNTYFEITLHTCRAIRAHLLCSEMQPSVHIRKCLCFE